MTARGLALGAALLLAACAAEDAAAPAPATPPAATPEALADRLPENLSGFSRGGTAVISAPRPGREVAYATPGNRAAAVVQVLRPDAPLADGFRAPEVEAEFQRWTGDVTRGAGSHRRLRVVRETEQAGLFRCAELEGAYGRQPVEGKACVGAAAGQMVRARVSMPRRDPPVADAEAFLRDLAASLRR
ncbi:hypothetical protein [Sabulicella glaciei]|uniref:Sensor domain-containing protein n=1 Tax=Sabulicella glaciei TaxID=2984948 RepID=A0ABT3NSS1_9PROT|nr:hypothetical protein [Roseococcus sp. MDT2-1-1]MCW8085204.1 hypothetical protein [Roseococcus sp. MDT2-1-1]